MADYNFLLSTRLNQDQQLALKLLQDICQQRHVNLYFTGGSMRDLLTGHTVRLLNFTTEGNPLPLESALAAAGGERLSPRAESATLSLSLRGCRMRIQAARLGDSTSATIHEDLRRRGLTLNSIGLSLNAGSRGLPLDPCNGAADIEARSIRMNHPYVFFEDPGTLLRAVRLRTRLDFAIEERTAARMETAREENYLARATPAARSQEWEAIAYEPDPAAVLVALEKEQWLTAAFGSSVRTKKMNLAGLGRLTATVESWELMGLIVDVGLVAMPMLMAGLTPADQTRLAQSLPSRHLAAGWKKLIAEAQTFEKRFLTASAGATWLRSAQEVIEKHSPEAVVYASINPGSPKAGKKLRDFHARALAERQKLPLGVLRALDLAPRSQQSEDLLRPWYKRLLAGEDLSEAALSEGIHAAALQLRAPAATPPGPAPAQKSARTPAKMPAQPPAKKKPASKQTTERQVGRVVQPREVPRQSIAKPRAKAALRRKK